MARDESERRDRPEGQGFALLPRKGEPTMRLLKSLALLWIVCGLPRPDPLHLFYVVRFSLLNSLPTRFN